MVALYTLVLVSQNLSHGYVSLTYAMLLSLEVHLLGETVAGSVSALCGGPVQGRVWMDDYLQHFYDTRGGEAQVAHVDLGDFSERVELRHKCVLCVYGV